MILPLNWEGEPTPSKYDIRKVVDVAYLKVPKGNGVSGTEKQYAKITIEWDRYEEGYRATLWWFNRGIEMASKTPSVEECKKAAFSWWIEFLTSFLSV